MRSLLGASVALCMVTCTNAFAVTKTSFVPAYARSAATSTGRKNTDLMMSAGGVVITGAAGGKWVLLFMHVVR